MALFETARAFIALNIEVAPLRRLIESVTRLRAHPSAPRASWVSPPRMHVTLKFLGEMDVGLAAPLRGALTSLARERATPRLAFSKLGAFPSVTAARVVFLEVEDMGGETASLATAVDELGEQLGFARETRPYHPHLTLARTREAVDVQAWLLAVPPVRVVALAPEVVLYRSDFARPGAEYEALGRFALSPRRSSKKTA